MRYASKTSASNLCGAIVDLVIKFDISEMSFFSCFNCQSYLENVEEKGCIPGHILSPLSRIERYCR